MALVYYRLNAACPQGAMFSDGAVRFNACSKANLAARTLTQLNVRRLISSAQSVYTIDRITAYS